VNNIKTGGGGEELHVAIPTVRLQQPLTAITFLVNEGSELY